MLAGDFRTYRSARYDMSAQAQPNWELLATQRDTFFDVQVYQTQMLVSFQHSPL
jgi:hypothetical protein